MADGEFILTDLQQRFGAETFIQQITVDNIFTLWLPKDLIVQVVQYLKTSVKQSYNLLYDLCGVDERDRVKKGNIPALDFTIVYHLFSFERNHFIRLKVAVKDESLSLLSITSVFKNANWYEREVYDMFGIKFEGHPHLQRILMPLTWSGHPLRKEHPARATEIEPFKLFYRTGGPGTGSIKI